MNGDEKPKDPCLEMDEHGEARFQGWVFSAL